MPEISKELKEVFFTLFRGRQDIYATRWEKNDTSGYMPAYQVDWKAYNKHKAQGGNFKNFKEKEYAPLTMDVLEQHWNGDILDSQDTVLKFAKSFVWAEKKATVTLWDKIYKTGKKLSVKAMNLHEKAIDRIDEVIGKWFVTINPDKVKEVLKFG